MSKCRITVVKKDLYADLIAQYCDPATVPCEIFEVGDEFLVDQESFFNLRFRKTLLLRSLERHQHLCIHHGAGRRTLLGGKPHHSDLLQ